MLDVRSNPDAMASGTLRFRQNFQCLDQNKLRRGCGWKKLLSNTSYNNEDFHDQLLSLSNDEDFTSIRQPITLLFEAESTRKVRNLIAAKQGAIAKLNEYSGNWRILGTGYGGEQTTSAAAPRFHCAQVGDFLAFTNDFESPMYHRLEDVSVAGSPLIQPFPDLATIGLSRAGVVWAWRNCLFFADVEMDGKRFAYRLIWSDFDNPTAFDPADVGSITGSKDLYTHERILAGRPLGNSFIIYTTHGIWEMATVGGDQSFAFARRYDGDDNPGATVLKYPNTLVSLPSAHAYLAEDGVHIFSPYYGQPERAEWLHRSTPIILDNIDTENCQVHVAAYHKNELLISTASVGATNNCPDRTLRTQMTYRVADKIDFGFTAFCNYRSFRAPTIRDFIVENDICTVEQLDAAGYPYDREGLPSPALAATAPFTPQSIYTLTPQTIGDVVVEDWTQLEADADSLCALLGTTSLDDFCRKCEGATMLVGASSEDWCLKQIGDVFYRERCANPTGVGETNDVGYLSSVGSYILDGYDSIIRIAPAYAKKMLLQLDELRIDFLARMDSEIGLRVGIASQVADPNTDECCIVWFQHSLKPIACLTAKTPAQHAATGTIPAKYAHWKVMRKGRVLCAELKISGTGGDADFSGLEGLVKAMEAERF